MQGLWELLTKHHKEKFPDLIKLSQITLTLPLHTASCERVFFQQNLILTKQRSSLCPATSDKLLMARLASNAGVILNSEDCLKRWHRLIKQNWQSERIHYKITLICFCLVFCPYRFTNTYPLMAHTFSTMAHTNLKWPIDLCQHGGIGLLTFFFQTTATYTRMRLIPKYIR